MDGDFNLAFTSGQTKTSSRRFLRGKHNSLTFRFSASAAGSWQAYSVDPQTQKRTALFVDSSGTPTARTITAGAGDEATVQGRRAAVELDYANSDATAGTYTWAVDESK